MKHTFRLIFLIQWIMIIPIITLFVIPTATREDFFIANAQMSMRDKGTPFGMVATVGNRVRVDEIPTIVNLMREAGVQWQREEIFWHHLQPYRGSPYQWSGNEEGFYNYDYAIQSQVEANIRILGLLDYNPAWFKGKNPRLDEWIGDWGDFVYNVVARYGRERGWIKYWELWNEPNLAPSGYESGLYEIKDFVRILEVGAAAAKSADPEAKIVMGGLAPTWNQQPAPHSSDYFDYLAKVGDAGGWNYVDILAIHPYRHGAPDGAVQGRQVAMDMRTELQHLDQLLLRYGEKPIWLTELGWSTHKAAISSWPGVDEDTQAFYLIRSTMMAIAHPNIEKVFWYDLRNDIAQDNAAYANPTYDEQNEQFHYGLLRRNYPLDPNWAQLRKPAFLAYRTMTQMLGGLPFQQILADGKTPDNLGVFWYRFSNGTRTVDVLWRIYDNTSELSISCGCKEALVRHWRGELKDLRYSHNGNVTISLETPGTPIYVEYDPPPRAGGYRSEKTGHTIRGGFQQYWQANDGLNRFGQPLTEEMIEPEPSSGRPRVVQYFEHGRFMHFPEYSGTPQEILISTGLSTPPIKHPESPISTPYTSTPSPTPPRDPVEETSLSLPTPEVPVTHLKKP